MTSDQIIALANKDAIGNGLDLEMILRTEACLEFFSDIGDVRWRRISTTLTLTIGTKTADLPDDFWKMIDLKIPPTGSTTLVKKDSLKYIGEDHSLVEQAEFNSVPAKPSGYYIVQRSSDSTWRSVKFDTPPDAAYIAYYTYLRGPVFADLSTPVDMDEFVPRELQITLAECLRRKILLDRVGQGDPRYAVAQAQYDKGIAKIVGGAQDQARRNYVVTVS